MKTVPWNLTSQTTCFSVVVLFVAASSVLFPPWLVSEGQLPSGWERSSMDYYPRYSICSWFARFWSPTLPPAIRVKYAEYSTVFDRSISFYETKVLQSKIKVLRSTLDAMDSRNPVQSPFPVIRRKSSRSTITVGTKWTSFTLLYHVTTSKFENHAGRSVWQRNSSYYFV